MYFKNDNDFITGTYLEEIGEILNQTITEEEF